MFIFINIYMMNFKQWLEVVVTPQPDKEDVEKVVVTFMDRVKQALKYGARRLEQGLVGTIRYHEYDFNGQTTPQIAKVLIVNRRNYNTKNSWANFSSMPKLYSIDGAAHVFPDVRGQYTEFRDIMIDVALNPKISLPKHKVPSPKYSSMKDNDLIDYIGSPEYAQDQELELQYISDIRKRVSSIKLKWNNFIERIIKTIEEDVRRVLYHELGHLENSKLNITLKNKSLNTANKVVKNQDEYNKFKLRYISKGDELDAETNAMLRFYQNLTPEQRKNMDYKEFIKNSSMKGQEFLSNPQLFSKVRNILVRKGVILKR